MTQVELKELEGEVNQLQSTLDELNETYKSRYEEVKDFSVSYEKTYAFQKWAASNRREAKATEKKLKKLKVAL